jgi:hypothetical protein
MRLGPTEIMILVPILCTVAALVIIAAVIILVRRKK